MDAPPNDKGQADTLHPLHDMSAIDQRLHELNEKHLYSECGFMEDFNGNDICPHCMEIFKINAIRRIYGGAPYTGENLSCRTSPRVANRPAGARHGTQSC